MEFFFLINPCPANQIDVISIPANQVDVISKAKVVFLNLALHRLFQYILLSLKIYP